MVVEEGGLSDIERKLEPDVDGQGSLSLGGLCMHGFCLCLFLALLSWV